MTKRSLEGKVALITGAVRRTGRATALALAGEGASIVVHAKNSEKEANSVAREIRDLGGQAIVQLADISEESAVEAMVAQIIDRFARIDILVNNAALRAQAPFTEMSFDQWRKVMATILDGTFLCSRACIPHMVRQGGGAIVNLGGASAHLGASDRAHIVAAKAGVVGLTRALAVEFRNKGITVNCVAPGKIGDERSQAVGEPASGGSGLSVERMGEPADVAAMILTLCLPTGRFVTGQTIHVNGGTFFS